MEAAATDGVTAFDAAYQVAIFTVAIIAASYARLTHKKAKNIDDAVNHTHGTGKPRIYDLAQSTSTDLTAMAVDLATVVHRLDNLAGEIDSMKKVDRSMQDAIHLLQTIGHELADWRKSFQGGPLDNGEKVIAFVSRTDDRLGAVEQMIAHHVSWEESAKYNELTDLLIQLRAAVTASKVQSDGG